MKQKQTAHSPLPINPSSEEFDVLLEDWVSKGYSKAKVFSLIEQVYPDDQPEQTQQGGSEQ